MGDDGTKPCVLVFRGSVTPQESLAVSEALAGAGLRVVDGASFPADETLRKAAEAADCVVACMVGDEKGILPYLAFASNQDIPCIICGQAGPGGYFLACHSNGCVYTNAGELRNNLPIVKVKAENCRQAKAMRARYCG